MRVVRLRRAGELAVSRAEALGASVCASGLRMCVARASGLFSGFLAWFLVTVTLYEERETEGAMAREP